MVPIIRKNNGNDPQQIAAKAALLKLATPVSFCIVGPEGPDLTVFGGMSKRLTLAASMLEGAGRLDASPDQQQLMVDNAYRLADMLIEGDAEISESPC